jgi:hypothetical protein
MVDTRGHVVNTPIHIRRLPDSYLGPNLFFSNLLFVNHLNVKSSITIYFSEMSNIQKINLGFKDMGIQGEKNTHFYSIKLRSGIAQSV